jgi:hypothetical protein
MFIVNSSDNLNKNYDINDNIYIFTQLDNNKSTIEINCQNNGYIVFNISNDTGNIEILNGRETLKLTNNSSNNINVCENTKLIITCFNLNKNEYIKLLNLKFYYNNHHNIVLITSKIYVSNKPFTYTTNRSFYTPEQRLNQTIETIKSIKKYISNYYIVLFDNSNFNKNEYNLLNSSVNVFINITNNKKINFYTNNSKNKAYGELTQTHVALYYIKNIPFNNFFKISGRYKLNEFFNYKNYDNNYNIFKKRDDDGEPDYYYTSLYKISNINFNKYIDVINNLFNEIQISNKFNNKSYEVFFPSFLEFNTIPSLGLVEIIATSNEINNI